MRALRPTATLLAALWILLAAPALAVTITGHVQKGLERAPAAGVPVSLHLVKGDQELPGKTTTSGPDGSFRFDGLPTDPAISHFLSTEYEGAFYTEGPIDVTGGSGTQDLVIYEVGRDIASVRVTNHHIVVERNPDHLHVSEILVIENTGKTAYLGVGLNHAENAGIRMGLPASVKEFEPGVGGDTQTVRVQGRDLASVRPIPPGTRPFSFTYHVPLSGRMDLSHRLYFPTDKIVVLMNDPELKMESASLEYVGPREQGGRTFQVYQASNLPVGAEVPMRVRGAGFWSNPRIYPWLAAPFVIVAILLFAARRGRRAPAPARAPDAAGAPSHGEAVARVAPMPNVAGGPLDRRPSAPAVAAAADGSDDDFTTIYLYLIDALDRGLERGEFSKESHDLVRQNLKRRLEAILADRPRTGTR